MKFRQNFSILFLLIFTGTEASGSCCAEGETLTADHQCEAGGNLRGSVLQDSCQGRLQQIPVDMFEMTKFGGWLLSLLYLPGLSFSCIY